MTYVLCIQLMDGRTYYEGFDIYSEAAAIAADAWTNGYKNCRVRRVEVRVNGGYG